MTLTTAPPDVAALAVHFADLKARLKELHAEAEQAENELIAAMDQAKKKEVTVEGVGHLIRHYGKKRTQWNHDDLYREMVRLSKLPAFQQVDRDTGAVESEAEALLRLLRESLQPAYWRAGALRATGLVADEFCSTTMGRATVEIRS